MVGVKPSRRVAESLVVQILRVIKSLKLSQPKDLRHRSIAARRAKAHEAITEWVSSMLVPYSEDLVQESVEQEAAEKDEDVDKKLIKEDEKVASVRYDHFGEKHKIFRLNSQLILRRCRSDTRWHACSRQT